MWKRGVFPNKKPPTLAESRVSTSKKMIEPFILSPFAGTNQIRFNGCYLSQMAPQTYLTNLQYQDYQKLKGVARSLSFAVSLSFSFEFAKIKGNKLVR